VTLQGTWVLDGTDGYLERGDVVIAPYRGQPEGRFEVLDHDGRGMVRIIDPDGKERPLRPNTLLRRAVRIERGDATVPMPELPAHDLLGGW